MLPLADRFPGLPQPSNPPTGVTGRFCLATQEVNGPFRNGGIGTAYTSLAESLARAGHDVTLLFLRGDYCERGSIDDWIEHYARKGVRLVPLPTYDALRLHGSAEAAVSYRAYLWLRSEPRFDVVHFPELSGAAFYSVAAKRQGIAFADSTFCIGTHSPIRWIRESNGEYLHGLSDVEMDVLERRSVALADVVVSPSAYLLSWMEGAGFELPASCFVQQNLLPESARGADGGTGANRDVEELVFFGRLETRKGLELFVEAVDRLVPVVDDALRITFMGRPARVRGRDSEEFLAEHTGRWPFAVEILTGLGQSEAMDYLRVPGRVAVIPSFVENSPYTVLECLGAGIPFLAADVGGIGELIAAEDRDRVGFAPTSSALADAVRRCVAKGARPARPSVAFAENETRWVTWHATIADSYRSRGESAERPDRFEPPVRVCVQHGHDERLESCLSSLRGQSYRSYEIVLAPEISSAGEARNRAADQASATYLLFTSDRFRSRPEAIETYVAVARATGAELVTSVADARLRTTQQKGAAGARDRFLFVGAAPDLGAFKNAFGFPHVLVRRDVFEALGGFSTDARDGALGWEFLARAVLAGHDLQVVPEPLFELDVDADALLDEGERLRGLLPYLVHVPGELRGFLRYAQSLELRRGRADGEAEGLSNEDVADALQRARKLGLACEVLVRSGEHEACRSLIGSGLELLQREGSQSALVEFLLGSARCLDRLGDTSGALDLLAVAIRIGSETPSAETFHHALLDAGRQLVHLGEIEAARNALASAGQLAARNGLEAERLEAAIAEAWAAGSAGEIVKARTALETALVEAKALEDGSRGGALHLEAGERLAELGIDDLALEALHAASQLGWQAGDRGLVASARRALQRVEAKPPPAPTETLATTAGVRA